MTSRTTIALTAAASALFAAASPSARADAPTLPTFGHFIGYTTVAAPSSVPGGARKIIDDLAWWRAPLLGDSQ